MYTLAAIVNNTKRSSPGEGKCSLKLVAIEIEPASDLDPFLTMNLGNCILLSYFIVYNYKGIKRSALLVISTTGESEP